MDLTSFDGLASAQKQVSSLAEAEEWATSAKAHMHRLSAIVADCDQRLASLPAQHVSAKIEAMQRRWWQRLFSSALQKDLKLQETEHTTRKQRAIATSGVLQGLIDDTPTNEAERVALLKDLKATKKSLQLDKRELGAQLRDIRADARRKSTNAATGFLALATDRKFTAMDRRNIRAAKERAVAGPEQLKNLIDRQILDVERQIARIEALR